MASGVTEVVTVIFLGGHGSFGGGRGFYGGDRLLVIRSPLTVCTAEGITHL